MHYKAYNYLGNISFHEERVTKDFGAAIDFYKKAIEMKPDFDMPENSLGVIYKEYKKIDVAIDYFNKCLKKNSRNALAHFALGNIEWEKNHLK